MIARLAFVISTIALMYLACMALGPPNGNNVRDAIIMIALCIQLLYSYVMLMQFDLKKWEVEWSEKRLKEAKADNVKLHKKANNTLNNTRVRELTSQLEKALMIVDDLYSERKVKNENR
jgi:hypothetical protein